MTYGQPQAPMSFADAPAQNDFTDLIPNGTLAFGVFNIKWFNADQGIVETPSKSSDAKFVEGSVTIIPNPVDGFVSPFAKRKIFTRIGTAGSEAYVNMGRSAIKAMLETGKGAVPNNPASYEIDSYADLDGLIVAIKIKEEAARPPYGAKNDIALWLSPVDKVTEKDWARLIANDVMPRAKAAPSTGTANPGWAGTPAAAPAATNLTPPAASRPAAAVQANPLSKPAFLGGNTAGAPTVAGPTSGWRPNQ